MAMFGRVRAAGDNVVLEPDHNGLLLVTSTFATGPCASLAMRLAFVAFNASLFASVAAFGGTEVHHGHSKSGVLGQIEYCFCEELASDIKERVAYLMSDEL